MSYELERNVLRSFFESVAEIQPLDNSVSDSKLIRQTQAKLKVALRGVTARCSCAKRNYGPCEVCQASGGDLAHLRMFFIQIRKAKKFNMMPERLEEFFVNYKKWIAEANE